MNIYAHALFFEKIYAAAGFFQWAFCALPKADTGAKPTFITRDTALKSGDQIKFFVKLEPSVYLYFIYRSSQGEISVLFPHRFNQLDDNNSLSGKHYIPQGNQWFELDEHTGEEKFYLLASASRLFELEALINQYGFQDVRVRHYGNQAVIEVPFPQVAELEALSNVIIPGILSLGFTDCTIDKEGLVSGKLNRSLEIVSNEGFRS